MRIPELKFRSGERLPIVLTDAGTPHPRITLYATSQLRNRGLSASTMHSTLRSICKLYAWAESKSIDLERRFRARQFFTKQEAEGLVAALRKRKSLADGAARLQHRNVEPLTSNTRLTCVAAYVEWLAGHVIEASAKSLDASAIQCINGMCRLITSRKSRRGGRSPESERKGLAEPEISLLADVMQPGSPANPFRKAIQTRNAVIHQLLGLGLRAGELLALKVSDFDFQANEVVVPRRHGDPEDPRRRQPVAKTNDRRLALSEELSSLVYEYVVGDRRRTHGAPKHSFLLVVHQKGSYLGWPLSEKGLEKLFRRVRGRTPELAALTPHVLRHTANDAFSEVMDAAGVSPAEEEKMRSYAMGWKEGSGSARVYTRRTTQRKAREAMLAMQKRILKPKRER